MKAKYLFFFILIFSSCSVSFRSIKSKGGIKNLKDLTNVNGSYGNAPSPGMVKTLENILFVTYVPRLEGDDNSTITLEVLNKKRIKAKLYSNGILLKTKILKGKIKGDYFWVRRRTKFHLKKVFLNYLASTKFRIGILGNGNLTIDLDEGGGGLLIILPFYYSSYMEHKAIFRRVND